MPKKLLKIILPVLILSLAGIGVSIGVSKFNLALAQNINDSGVVYPIKELGNCADKGDCKKYCDIKKNQEACLDFAQSHGMMPKREIEQAKKMLQLSKDGVDTPGSCKGQEECDAYCDDSAHLDECVSFGEKAGLLSSEEVKMIKKTGGKGPGSCQGKKACDAYCENEANLDECILFAEQNGLMTAQEKEMIKKTGGKGPGGCKSKESCDAYCQQEANFDTCLEFGHQYGMMSDEEYQMAKKMGSKMMKQGGPGGCKNKKECDAFCNDEKNFDTCLEFGKQNGMMGEEEYQMAKKMGPKMMKQGGPGGCKGKKECEDFCNNPANAEECLKFSVDNGMMNQEEADKMKQRGFMVPPKDALGPNGEFAGPGGCKTQEECGAFCSQAANAKVCAMFGAGPPPDQAGEGQNGRQMAPGTTAGGQKGLAPGPGGCDSPTACMKFCSEPANQDTCMRFTPPSPRADQAPGTLQVPRIEPGQNQPQQPGSGGGESGQGMGLPPGAPGEQREGMAPGQPEFGAPPPGYQSPGEFNQPMEENRLNEGLPLQEARLLQPPVGEAGQQPGGIQLAPRIESSPFVQEAPPAEFQAPAPASEPAPTPQASSGGGFVASIFNFLASAMTSLFGK
ncbi:hypothetical protein KKF25_01895 [Patescibacteria group bacterium]|nr:hypothetical protein [Patescibacteria group bacterium]